MHDSRETFVNHAFVAGYPITHSRSPIIHGYWLNGFGLDGSYTKQAVTPEDFPEFMDKLRDRSSGFCGGNVTIPHKEAAFALSDRPDDLAMELGAANTLWLEDGRIHASNTDGEGFIANLDQRAPGWNAADSAVILGAGGASRAIVQAVRNRGFTSIHVVNRTLARAQELSDRFGPAVHAHPMEALPALLQDARLLINTTSLGMNGSAVPAFDFTRMAPGALVTDIVYVPLITPLLAQARAQGLVVVDGLGMLLHQAVPGFERWFRHRPAVDDTLRQLVIDDMERHP